MIPIVAGLLMGAAMGGGIAALQKKDILQGAVMGGIGGALGGAFMPAVAGAGSGVASAVSPAMIEAGTSGVAGAALEAGALGAAGGVGGAGSGGIGAFLGANKYALAGGALGGMMAPGQEPKPADQGNIYTTAFNQERNPEFGVTPGASYFTQSYDPGTYSKASDYNPTMTAANGGIIALAEGGQALEPYKPVETNRYTTPVRAMTPEVAAYNEQMMARANQQYNVNPRPLPIQVPGSPGSFSPSAAPAGPAGPSDFIDDYYQQMLGRNADPTGRKLIEEAMKAGGGYDAARDIPDVIRRSEEFKLSGKSSDPKGIEIGKKYGSGSVSSDYSYDPRTGRYSGGIGSLDQKSEIEKLREEMNMLRGGSSYGYENLGGDVGANASNAADNAAAAVAAADAANANSQDGIGTPSANGGRIRQRYNMGGLSSLGAYSDGGQLLKGPGDGVSDSIPAQIGRRQPARLADGEFVVPARTVSELGNGSTDAGAKQLYKMMDRVQNARKKSIGKGKVAVDSKAHKMLPA